jgi:hypothetical protein
LEAVFGSFPGVFAVCFFGKFFEQYRGTFFVVVYRHFIAGDYASNFTGILKDSLGSILLVVFKVL